MTPLDNPLFLHIFHTAGLSLGWFMTIASVAIAGVFFICGADGPEEEEARRFLRGWQFLILSALFSLLAGIANPLEEVCRVRTEFHR